MSVNGIVGGAGSIGLPPERAPVRSGDRSAPGGTPQAGAAPREALGLGAGQGALPSEPPAGTDPELWSLLTTEERAYYARVQALGPLTYRPGAAAAPQQAVARGGRIDLRA